MDTTLQDLKIQVCEANMKLKNSGLVKLTWGNVSGLTAENKIMAIKPSGVDYKELTPEKIVLTSLDGAEQYGSEMAPSSDAPTHMELYRAFPSIKGIAHTHSTYATAWAQAGAAIPCYGTTHADAFYGEVPVCDQLRQEQVESDYEVNVGKMIVAYFSNLGLDPEEKPGVLVPGHGPFSWGKDAEAAVENAIILEEVAKMACLTRGLQPCCDLLPDYILNKHFSRKHGPDSYYGQS